MIGAAASVRRSMSLLDQLHLDICRITDLSSDQQFSQEYFRTEGCYEHELFKMKHIRVDIRHSFTCYPLPSVFSALIVVVFAWCVSMIG